MADQDIDQSEAASPFKLQKAREKGQVAKSADLVSAIVFATAVVYLAWQGWNVARDQFRFDQAFFDYALNVATSGAGLVKLIDYAIRATFYLGAPFLLVLVIAAVVGNVVQSGVLFSLESLKFDLDRINPIEGFKRVWSLRTLFDGARAIGKFVVLVLVAYWSLTSLAPQFYSLSSLSAVGYTKTLIADLAEMGFKMALILGLIATLDLIYTRYEFMRKMRMSRRELKDEVKNREGDPRIRARLRQLRQEALKRSLALRDTKNADVILTNPTHYCIALRYEHGQMNSPVVIAKGTGKSVLIMRMVASRHRIPVVESPVLARKIFFETSVGNQIALDVFADVAKILVWVYAMRESANASNRIDPRRAQ